MPEFSSKKNVIILCNRWYVKKDLICVADEYKNPDLIGNARSDSVIYYLPLQPTGKRGKPALHGKRLSIQDDFVLSDEKIGDYYIAARHVLTNIFGKRKVAAYVTSPEKTPEPEGCFLAQSFQNRWRFSVHGRKNPH